MSDGDLILVENVLWVLTAPTGIPIYDFDFSLFFECKHPWQRPPIVQAVPRVGVYERYAEEYAQLLNRGIKLIHTPEDHLKCSELPQWYEVISDLTPKSVCFDRIPEAAEVGAALNWPVFVKGQRQTSRHKRNLSIIKNAEAFKQAAEHFANDPILRWQGIVCREYVSLRPIEDALPDRIPSSFEFRTFWWRGELVGIGRYWWEGKTYELTPQERQSIIELAGEVARRIAVPFLVVDVAQTESGRWIVIECNDGQESGYAGVAPLAMWRRIIDIEQTAGGT